jgi:hypothetical protein
MQCNAAYIDRLHAIRDEILTEIRKFSEHRIENKEKSGEDEISKNLSEPEPELATNLASELGDEVDDGPESSPEIVAPERAEFRVGIFCAMGRHRSVAMLEELAKLNWPCEVEFGNRDVARKRGDSTKGGGKKGRGVRGGGMSSQFEDKDWHG